MELENVKALVQMMDGSSVHKLKLKTAELELVLEKESVQQVVQAPAMVVTEQTSGTGSVSAVSPVEEVPHVQGTSVVSPLVGAFYEGNSPESGPLVTVGSRVKKGDVLCIIEAMKIFNEIKAPKDGTITAIHVKNGDLIAYDQVLMEIGD